MCKSFRHIDFNVVYEVNPSSEITVLSSSGREVIGVVSAAILLSFEFD
jgi:hypothetical protein